MNSTPIHVTVWGENVHDRTREDVKLIYPEGMHTTIAAALDKNPDITARTATLEMPEHGLPAEVLAQTDVLTWWGHTAHEDVDDAVAQRVAERVHEGMGLIVLHSAHLSKPFLRLMGTSGSLRWREAGERERLWNIAPSHPITEGIGDAIELPRTEMYGERFDIPTPDELIFISWFQGGEVFRSGCTWQRGHGRVFYFRPGHETYPIYHDEQIQRVLLNACRWARARVRIPPKCPRIDNPPEPLEMS
jgi:trehalose utilization protein